MLLPVTDATANNSLLEGLACGVPVVATDVGGIRDYLAEDCGFLVAPGDTSGYVDCLLSVLSSPEKRALMSKAARSRGERFSWANVAAMMAGVYAELCCGARSKALGRRRVRSRASRV